MLIKEPIYLVAGDEMQKLMSEKYPERKIIPFCEDLSKGSYEGYSKPLNVQIVNEYNLEILKKYQIFSKN